MSLYEYTGLHHVAFATQDIEATVRFWRDLLGMRLVYAYGRPGYRQYFFEVSGDSRISFFEWPEVKKLPLRRHGDPVDGPFAFDHISVGVENDNRLWDMMGRLEGAEIPCSDLIDHGYFHSIYSYDPNGIPIEFTCNAPGLNVLDRPDLRDDQPEESILCRSEPVPGRWPKPDPIPEEERIMVSGEGSDHFQLIT
ncbi:Glyoxalase/bleomycin resistance protein/dioxygenase [Magnetococcus marinus MC-1]|uniref:Glyoxalase/bleomycin resistance protein/dioxygenase n=1 Tax=Magnetococcus marinus (strain ATCC BAA-1437 / JCM 17883 / MC-1) TaxID=156889 RepID=A0L7Y3_MAGMM|nr:VOC family protein [Magnetococcus marinus]ABK44076.1 Glyoxalase/bleomycin resistance protein/dioxygenase [Magnetococcus marinus MC-1]